MWASGSPPHSSPSTTFPARLRWSRFKHSWARLPCRMAAGLRTICMQVLPEEYGGDAPLMPIDRAVAQQRKRSHALASQSRPALEKVPDAAKGRAAAGGR